MAERVMLCGGMVGGMRWSGMRGRKSGIRMGGWGGGYPGKRGGWRRWRMSSSG